MTRKQAETIATRIATAMYALEDNRDAVGGLKLAAVSIASIVAEDGKIGAETFLSLCGIPDPRKPEKTFRGKRRDVVTPKQRYLEAIGQA